MPKNASAVCEITDENAVYTAWDDCDMGIGSGLDVMGIVDKFMVAQQQGLNKMNQKKSSFQNQASAYAVVKNAMTELDSSLNKLNTVLNQSLYKITSSNEQVISAVSNTPLQGTGTYTINVSQVAQAHQINSTVFSSKTDSLQLNGILTIMVNNNTLNLAIDPTDSLETIQNNINISNQNPGVIANIIKTQNTDGTITYHLVLTSSKTGTANQITLGGDALNSLDLTHTIQEAQDAKLSVNGFSTVSSSNLISDLIQGLTFNLNGTTGAATINIAHDSWTETDNISNALESLVQAYNQLMENLSKNQSLSAYRDSTYQLIQMALKNSISNEAQNQKINSMVDLGIVTDKPQSIVNEENVKYIITGKLRIKQDELKSALQNNFNEVQSFFIDTQNGLIKTIRSSIDQIEHDVIPQREHIINQQKTDIEDQIDKEKMRVQDFRKNLIKKYAALDTFLAKYDNIGSFLKEQFKVMKQKF